MKRREIMWAEMSPDLYAGETCDQVRPRWHCHAEGDMDSDHMESISLDAKHFVPGTKIVVMEPECPQCGMVASCCITDKACDFDWDAWRDDKYQ